MTRRSLSTRERLRLFTLHGGICHFCEGKITPGEAWEISHDIPLELLGADDDVNRKPAHKKCHRRHTSEVDIPAISKAKRREANHTGARSRTPWPKRPKTPAAPQRRASAPLEKWAAWRNPDDAA